MTHFLEFSDQCSGRALDACLFRPAGRPEAPGSRSSCLGSERAAPGAACHQAPARSYSAKDEAPMTITMRFASCCTAANREAVWATHSHSAAPYRFAEPVIGACKLDLSHQSCITSCVVHQHRWPLRGRDGVTMGQLTILLHVARFAPVAACGGTLTEVHSLHRTSTGTKRRKHGDTLWIVCVERNYLCKT